MKEIKNYLRKITAGIILSTLCSFQSFTKDIQGIWLTRNGDAKIQIYQTSDKTYLGKLVWTKDKSEKAQKLHGISILTNVIKIEDEKYEGKVYDPEKNQTYSCTITLNKNNVMELRGYIGISLLGRTERWTRIQN
ncbi:DUF2147 domain-containing protein [Chryseobacterium sp. KBW03]|uniref:DUF2147 domain-containing protein n=1 Tax=Chryseobacterium sp. KBW03 TaxID=2153362 RepID=UPI000F5912B2|nr:DUF2147 domain-containing protein [Chryseobacterium sp. KBW03]RQO42562.1 DUF2147 domain-containing protein [Chryseobacterium sp. KBW03]